MAQDEESKARLNAYNVYGESGAIYLVLAHDEQTADNLVMNEEREIEGCGAGIEKIVCLREATQRARMIGDEDAPHAPKVSLWDIAGEGGNPTVLTCSEW